jgi:hypothetical protein
VTSLASIINLGCVLKRRPYRAADWDQELVREYVLRLRHERWCANSTHIVKVARKIAIVWLLLRHGVDIADAIAAVTGASPSLSHVTR